MAVLVAVAVMVAMAAAVAAEVEMEVEVEVEVEVVGGLVQDLPPFVFFLAGTIFFEASPNRNKNRQTSNKERDDF